MGITSHTSYLHESASLYSLPAMLYIYIYMYIYNRDLHMLIFIYNRYIHMNPVSLALLATSGVCVLSRETTLTNIMITQMDKYKAAINK